MAETCKREKNILMHGVHRKVSTNQRLQCQQKTTNENMTKKHFANHRQWTKFCRTYKTGMSINVRPLMTLVLFFLGYSKTVKKFSRRRQTVTKFNIAKLIMNEELAQQMEDGNICISSLNSAMTSPETNVTVESAPSPVHAHQCSASQTPLETYSTET
ncbi:hypothetical protein PR048_026400 [Dryococelus australis]|uniref:Uncharacterized protein n=1 Tax=Dryococelus australis TaxID=614101 RepID=A0ABQ9GLA9_9NEOP|nr:hypothetical protein PR048_026400 [Dryococelus australis]